MKLIRKIMSATTRTLLVAAFLIYSVMPAHAAFLESLWGARPASLGGAFTAIADDANAPAYNPAGLSLIKDSEMTFMYAQLFSGLDANVGDETSKLGLGYFSYAPAIKDKAYGSYAVSWSNLTASNLYREDTFTLSFADARQFESLSQAPILAYGVNLKYLRRSFSTDSRTDQDPVFKGGRDSGAPTLDLGIIYKPNLRILPGLKVGLAGQNLTEPDIGLAQTDRVPMKLSLGVAYQDPAFRLFTPTLELSRRRGRTLFTAGVESWLAKEVLAVRVGGNEDEIGGGIGYQFKLGKTQMRLDYGLLVPLEVNDTNGSHRLSISAAF